MYKRSVDILFSFLMLAAALPVLLVAAVAIKIDSDGPILFCQERMGRGFRRFQLLKLRTMNLAGDGPAYTLGADPRITRCGRWLRKFKIDELPQLWNVLRGEMSLVGPRPVIPELTMEFFSAYAHLLQVRPGLTDPASLKYFREAEILAAAPDPMHYFKTVVTPDKLRIAQEYLQKSNLWSDLAVLAQTAVAVVFLLRKPRLPVFQRRERQILAHPLPMAANALTGRMGKNRLAYRHFRSETVGLPAHKQRNWV